MDKTNEITKAIRFRLAELENGFNCLVSTNAPTEIIKECNHRIDELKSLLDHINKEIIK